jgi:glycosyltransferase involved in cell wall biosynthesis
MTVAERSRGDEERADDRAAAPVDVLVVGTETVHGGITQYIHEQRERLPDSVAVSFYDMHSPPPGSGVRWAVRAAVLMVLAAVRFPFRQRPEVVHVHTSDGFSFYRAAGYVVVASWLWRRPVVVHVHGSSFDEFVADPPLPVAALQSVVFRASARVVVLSEYWHDVLAGRIDPGKLVVLPNAVDPDRYDPQFGAGPPRVVFVSTLIDRKGIPEFLDAVDRLRSQVDARFRVDVAGDGPHADAVAALADRAETVTYHGYVSESRKHELLSEGSIYVLPTHAENLPIALLEGMAGGNAVVSTPVGGIPNVVGEDQGVLVAPGDVAALADALAGLLEAPDRVERMGRRNRRFVEANNAWDGAVDRLESLYLELATAERATPAAAG